MGLAAVRAASRRRQRSPCFPVTVLSRLALDVDGGEAAQPSAGVRRAATPSVEGGATGAPVPAGTSAN